ncbi:MAG: hypothetical protein AB1756_02485 [Acidobacteriota bacterium]
MKDSTTKGFIQGYNAQVAVDAKAQIIVAAEVTDEPNDKKQVKPMVTITIDTFFGFGARNHRITHRTMQSVLAL